MTRFIHDQFAKDYLEELLNPYGVIETDRRVSGEVRQIDVWFSPHSPESNASTQALGLLGRLAAYPSIFEPFRNAANQDEICDCLLKLLEVRGEVQRAAKRNDTKLQRADLPKLWILTPTASVNILSEFGATMDIGWVTGVYFMAPALRAAIIAIHQLPRTPETLWLRILGKETVQKQAIDELEALPEDNLIRANALKLLYNLQRNLGINQNLDEEDRQLIMRLAPLYEQDREEAIQEGERLVVENLLRVRFGDSEELSAIISPILELPPEEFTPLLLQLSREELLARFGKQN